jgi:hypothetical protein
MFAAKIVRTQAVSCTRNYGRTPVSNPLREVLVSQSRDLARNTALEDWAVRNIDLGAKNLLVLTNNLSKSPLDITTVDIKATLLCSDATDKAAEFEELVLSALPPSLPLTALPDLERGRSLLTAGAVGHSVRLELGQDVAAKTVLTALNSIAKAFLQEQQGVRRISLVRPDDGWFSGIEAIRTEVAGTISVGSKQMAMREREERRDSRGPVTGRGDKKGLKNSFGN